MSSVSVRQRCGSGVEDEVEEEGIEEDKAAAPDEEEKEARKAEEDGNWVALGRTCLVEGLVVVFV